MDDQVFGSVYLLPLIRDSCYHAHVEKVKNIPVYYQDTNILLRTQKTVNVGFGINKFLRYLMQRKNSGRIHCLHVFLFTAAYQFLINGLRKIAYVPSLGCHHLQGDTFMILLSNSSVPDTNRDSLEHVSDSLVRDKIPI